ncbi:hypothetical protein IC229_22290 [Spirosoma sp. BT702]|uniref:Transcription regulator TrmB N-terminal domain-containing protein n=1 Tax=Spirosoma profusum TaxID=2771354 RepID=A0A926XZX2_9BACT|nr:hypothetical protein [Spirosoma profusum]
MEADVYLLLLQEDALTGYKVGKQLGKPTANVYKALDSLAKKGAVLVEDEKNRRCKAVSIQELCDLVEAGIQRKTRQARELFQQPKRETYDERSYQLQSVDLVLSRCRQMLRNCTTIALLDLFPKLVKTLRPDIDQAIDRGIEVYLQVYQPVEIRGAKLTVLDMPQVLAYWQSQQLNLVIDGKEHLLALLSGELSEVYQASWSRNLYLSAMLHMGFSNHFTVNCIRQLGGDKAYETKVEQLLEQQSILSSGKIPGVGEMLARFGLSKERVDS